MVRIPLQVISDLAEMNSTVLSLRSQARSVGFVPTMGALHEGHLSLMRRAKQACDVVIVSLFVNPAQFGPNEDFDAYPRRLEADRVLCEQAGVHYLFAPPKESIYPDEFQTKVQAGRLGTLYCGKTRPVFFDGILTIVSILFHIVPAHRAYFGEKDFQQLFLIKQMVRDLRFDIEVVGCPIIREADGLAMSSRNAYLSGSYKEEAICLHRAIKTVQISAKKGEKGVEMLLAQAKTVLQAAKHFEVDYCVCVDPDTFAPVKTLQKPARLLLAGYMHAPTRTRLIDNALIEQA